MARKPDQIMRERVEIVRKQILKGNSIYDIMEYCQTEYKVQKSQAANYFKLASKELIEAARVDLKEQLGKAVARYEYILAKAISSGDLRLAALITTNLVELLGLKTIKIDIATKVIYKTQIGDDGVIRSSEETLDEKDASYYLLEPEFKVK